MQEMAQAWEEYSRLERSVEQLRMVLQTHMNHSATPQVRSGSAAQSSSTSTQTAQFQDVHTLYLHIFFAIYFRAKLYELSNVWRKKTKLNQARSESCK